MKTRYHNLDPELKELLGLVVEPDEYYNPLKTVITSSDNAPIHGTMASPLNVERIEGKTIVNHVPLFDSGAWVTTSSGTVSVAAPNEIQITTTTTEHNHGSNRMHLFPNTQYTLNGIVSAGTKLNVMFYDANTQAISTEPYSVTSINGFVTFTTPSNLSFLRIFVYVPTNTVGTVKNISLVEGSTAQPFVANIKGVTNPTIVNETNGTSLTLPTTLYGGEYVERNGGGQLVKYKKFDEIILSDKQIWEWVSSSVTNHKAVRFTIMGSKPINPGYPENIGYLIGSKGQLIPNAYVQTSNQYPLWNIGGTYTFTILLANSDTGWGASYTPTADEIKAYFLGWKMYNGDSFTDTAYADFNGTGTKYWAVRWTPNCGYANNRGCVAGTGTPTLPTVSAKDSGYPNTSWQPYRLIYELATPVEEVIMPYGDLTLDKGANDLQVSSGRIVNEKPIIEARSNQHYYVNTVDTDTRLSYRTQNILSIYKDSVSDGTWMLNMWTYNNESYMYGRTNIFDKTAAYTLDYDPLYPWEVTAPLDRVDVSYYIDLVNSLNDSVPKIAKQADTMRRMLENVVNEDEGVEWIRPTLLNGFTFVSQNDYLNAYCKSRDGIVTINLFLTNASTTNSINVLQLPKGYRPKGNIVFPCMHYTTNSEGFIGLGVIGSTGSVQLANSVSIGKSTHIISATFKAKQ